MSTNPLPSIARRVELAQELALYRAQKRHAQRVQEAQEALQARERALASLVHDQDLRQAEPNIYALALGATSQAATPALRAIEGSEEAAPPAALWRSLLLWGLSSLALGVALAAPRVGVGGAWGWGLAGVLVVWGLALPLESYGAFGAPNPVQAPSRAVPSLYGAGGLLLGLALGVMAGWSASAAGAQVLLWSGPLGALALGLPMALHLYARWQRLTHKHNKLLVLRCVEEVRAARLHLLRLQDQAPSPLGADSALQRTTP